MGTTGRHVRLPGSTRLQTPLRKRPVSVKTKGFRLALRDALVHQVLNRLMILDREHDPSGLLPIILHREELLLPPDHRHPLFKGVDDVLLTVDKPVEGRASRSLQQEVLHF